MESNETFKTILLEIKETTTGINSTILSQITKIPKDTIDDWFEGKSAPIKKKDAVRVVLLAAACRATKDQAERLLHIAGHPPLDFLRQSYLKIEDVEVPSFVTEWLNDLDNQEKENTSITSNLAESSDSAIQIHYTSNKKKIILVITIPIILLLGWFFITRNNSNITVKEATSWPIVFLEDFNGNFSNWREGMKDFGQVGWMERKMINSTYVITSQTAGDFVLFSPSDSPVYDYPIYYFTVDVQKIIGGGVDDGCVVFFNETGDRDHDIFRIRDSIQIVTILGAHAASASTVYLDKTKFPAIAVNKINNMSILANNDEFTFFINGEVVTQKKIPRVKDGRIDIGTASNNQKEPVVCQFDNLKVYTPK